ncbi:MAG TPA: CaiB/BaiF CoA-transferase family protein [Thermoleophilaceae bacterium]|nr:CaiB/BaiF CoA-transferase family protein [Thermoleophilaceae bacterium]
MTSSSESPPLAGVRVADLSRVLAGPYCTMVLADMGAEVVKVERPEGGDETRSWGPPYAGGEAAYYLSVNRGKRSCALDLSKPEGRELALELCARADIVVENFKVGGADRLGVGYDQVAERNPTVVYCSITGFGSEREPRGRPGYDFVAQAESGLMSITGAEDGPPYKAGVAVVDVLTGLHASAAVLAALHGGEGARIEVPLLDSGLAALVNVAQNALVTGREPERHGNAHANIVPYQDFETSSGRIAVAAANDGLFRALCSVLALEALPADERFAANAGRVEHRHELVPMLQERFRGRPAEEWLPALDAAGVPAGKVRSVLDALAAADAAGRAATVTVDHPSAGPLELVASPIRGATIADPSPPPLLGEHTAEVLAELGRTPEQIADLAARGAIGLPSG